MVHEAAMEHAFEARSLGLQMAVQLKSGRVDAAFQLLYPAITTRTSFRLLDIIAVQLANVPWEATVSLLEKITATHLEGGWVVVATALATRLESEMRDSLKRAADNIRQGDAWYVTDIFGERVVGQALVSDLDAAMQLISNWRQDDDMRIRRSVGVGAHFWIKRAHGNPDQAPQAVHLLEFLSPMLEDRAMDVVKGVGWPLKTMGKYYPDILIDFMRDQLMEQHRKPHALLIRKAMKFLDANQRRKVLEG
jgi:3-methyladenine DNA glycosylase AlkD